ncbi:4-amino-4-deoxy-L-arabinose transferase-like glycosyltransferase [Winogradskyella epiphytica]|uniref:4-amino-4-deoxy-L-arabinose transferase-like glycosyltransferase n=1 Tax=Winogradskyella epiphytica TaxID=262005 RepID=A0A2V4XC42_9FLAO|nr:glycosyltransferase [Winogradskyella epiphytica]PYE79595.1 4-amino-4-deoxy-L-arabinose transferase-like glycosyltransferase [Winogradskyella epiphytica]GGW74080.1 glycosyl transferase [Winogradskyella epiphytica]
MIKYIEKYPVISLLLFVIMMLGFTIDAIPVSIMEARNFISAREMLTDNNWILTTMNGEARYEKPPLPTWLTAAFGYMFGISSVLALRLPALLFLASIGISVYLLSKELELRTSHSVINGFIALTSFYIIGITIEAPWDIYAHGFMLLALFQLFLMLKSESTSIVHSLLFVLFIAGSVLSKGPVSLYALFLPFLFAYGIAFKYKGGVLHFLKLLSLLIFGIVLGGWWYMHVRLADPETFNAIATRETSNWSSYNVRPFYYYWSFFVQSGLWTIPAFISLLYPYLKSRVIHLKAYRFSFFWTIIAVILLSIIPEKKSRYLMPVLIPLAFNIGFYIDYIIREFKNLKSKRGTLPIYFHFGLIGLLALLFWVTGFFLIPSLSGFALVRFVVTSIVLILIGIFIFKNLRAKNIKVAFYLLIAFMLSIGFLALPLAKVQAHPTYKPISEINADAIPLYHLDYVAPETIYNYGDKIPNLKTEEGFIVPEEKEFRLLTTSTNPEDIEALSHLYTIEFEATYDLNFSKNGYNKRLVNQLYKLTRK